MSVGITKDLIVSSAEDLKTSHAMCAVGHINRLSVPINTVGEAPQRKFEGRVYMMHARSEKAPCSSKSMHMAALDSRATVHIVNS